MFARLLLNLVLLAVVIGLGWFAWEHYETGQRAVKPVRLALMDANAVDRIQILHRQRFTELVKTAHGWMMKAPIEIRANDFRVRTLLKLLDSSSHADYAADDLDLAKYGLDHPETRIRFNDLSIAFGITNPVNDYRYVLAGNRVHLVEDHFYPLVSSQVGTLVALEMLPPDAKITWMQLPETELILESDGTWSNDSSLTADEVNETLAAWTSIQSFGVHDFMPREELGYVSIALENRRAPIEYIVTDTDPWLVIARPGIGLEYHFNVEHYDALLRPGADDEMELSDMPEDVRRDLLEALGGDDNKDPDAPW